jgi:exodeoxyribonuclease III
MVRIASWNVNGLRSLIQHSHEQVLSDLVDKMDVLCLQEIRCNDDTACAILSSFAVTHFIATHASTTRKGYSGTALLSKQTPQSWWKGFAIPDDQMNTSRPLLFDDDEGRILTAVFDEFCVVCVYAPNSGVGTLNRLEERVSSFEPALRKYIVELRRLCNKTIIVAGDLNVAATEMDIHNPRGRARAAGFTLEERQAFQLLLSEAGLRDTFRSLHPTRADAFSYWSNMAQSRERNKGWRLDYILSDSTCTIKEASIEHDIFGSDHAPVCAEIEIEESL